MMIMIIMIMIMVIMIMILVMMTIILIMITITIQMWGPFLGRIGLPPAVTGWAASCGDRP